MRLDQISLPNWDKFKIDQSLKIGSQKIVTLKLYSPTERLPIPPEGVKNMLAVDEESDEILWIAEIPISHGKYGTFSHISFNNNKLTAWCGSILCEIDHNNGKILKEEFVK
ncbi:MAG: hypothetical protein JSS76_17640 [Bacteroidetes bacterium]|nr:hypothetical protein [Bacteroidota bacterium]